MNEVKPVDDFTRLGNYLIDKIAYYAIIGLHVKLFEHGIDDIVGNQIYMVLLYFLFLYILVFTTLEYKFGKTLGKLITRTKVVDINGDKPTLTRTLIRTLARLIPLEEFSYAFSKRGIHDRLSGTFVVVG